MGELADRAVGLATCKALFERLEHVEKAAAGVDEVARSWLASMVWPRLVWPRELLLELRSVKFEAVPMATVADPLHDWATGWGTTKTGEDAINITKACKTLSGSRKHQVQ